MVEWDRVVLLNDYKLVTHMLHILYVISEGGVNIREGEALVWLQVYVELVMTMGMLWLLMVRRGSGG